MTHEAQLLSLLARIHGDGGHYTTKHGLEQSIADAHMEIARLHAERPGWTPPKGCTALRMTITMDGAVTCATAAMLTDSQLLRYSKTLDNLLLENFRSLLHATNSYFEAEQIKHEAAKPKLP